MSFLFRNWRGKICFVLIFLLALILLEGWVQSRSFLCLLGPAYRELAVVFDWEHLVCDTWCCLCWDSQVVRGEFRLFLWECFLKVLSWDKSCVHAGFLPQSRDAGVALAESIQSCLWHCSCLRSRTWCSSWCLLLSWGRNLNKVIPCWTIVCQSMNWREW